MLAGWISQWQTKVSVLMYSRNQEDKDSIRHLVQLAIQLGGYNEKKKAALADAYNQRHADSLITPDVQANPSPGEHLLPPLSHAIIRCTSHGREVTAIAEITALKTCLYMPLAIRNLG